MYVLADSWFISQEFIAGIQKINTKHTKKLHVIGMMKTNRNVTIYEATKKASGVPELKRREVKYNKEFKCFLYASVIIYQGIEMKAFWVKMKGQSDWKMIISTDISLIFRQLMKYYQIRWTIEVYFRESKQSLNIAERQLTDFDAQIANITSVNIDYLVLALKKRFTDYETMGALFREFKAEL